MRCLVLVAGLAAALIALPPAASAAPLLWKTSDGDSTVYLFGTMHALKGGLDWVSPAMSEALGDSDSLWLETEMGRGKRENLIRDLGSSPDDPLSARLEPDVLEAVANLSRRLGLDFGDLDGLRPWLAAATLSAAALRRDGFSQTGADLALAGEAATHGVSVAGFDPADTPIELFAGLAPETETALLAAIARDLAEDRPQHARLFEAWLAGDEAALVARGLDEMTATDPALYAVLIADRNRHWLPSVEKLMLGRGTHFVAVGVLHLVGPDSLQALLEQKGYVVEKVAGGP